MNKILDALMPSLRQQVLGILLPYPEKQWFLAELANALSTRPANIQREVASLAEAGILSARRDGKRVYYRADTDCPIYPELRTILEKTSGLVVRL